VDVATGDASPLQVPADAGLGLGIPGSLIAIELDSANGRLIAADEADASVAAVDVATGEKTLISGASRGTGPAFMSPSDVALIDAGRIAVADEGVHSIFLVDAATGDRTYLQSFGYDEPKKIAFDAVHHRLAVYDASRPGVYLVNLDDPSDYTFEDQVDSVASLAFDSAGTTLLAGRSGASEPVRVVLSPSAPKGPFMPNQRVGEGDPLEYVTAMACLDDVHVLVAQDDTHANYRTELMNVDTSGGAVFAQPTTTDAIAAFAPDGARVLACTFDRSWFLAPDTFATTLAHGNPATSLGTWATQGCAADSTAGTAYFAVTTTAGPPYASAITAVDATGFFRTISDATRGTGPALQWLVGLDRDPVSGLLYAADRDSDLVLAIDPATGNRTVLEMRQGSEDHSYSMAYDAARRRVLVSGYSTISAVDASTGARSLVSASDAWNLHGVGPGLAGTGDPIAVSPDGSIVYRTNLAMAALIAIDAESGDRIIVRR
jgi:DNA-binding beta-propeller fold protein YncE